MLRGKAALLSNLKARSAGASAVGEGLPCAYSHRACGQRRLDGFELCLRHILEDKTAPFKQCTYTAPKTNRRCTNAAPKQDRSHDRKEGRFCADHHRRMAVARQRVRRVRRPRETAETLLGELATSNAAALDQSHEAKRLLRRQDSLANRALEYASSSDSDTETPSVEQAWRRDNDSDADSIDSEQEDPLKHAGVYSQEEAALLLRDKLIRLQSLYIEQFKRLQHVLKEKRRKYLHTYRQEREKLGPIAAYKNDPNHHRKYARLQAMRRYHRFFGKEALLHQKCNLRRVAVAEGVNHRPPTFPRCVAPTADGRCNKRVVPAAKFCMTHILQDPHQVLFERCAFRQGQCAAPVFSLDSAPNCRRHYAATPARASASSQTEDPAQPKAAAGQASRLAYASASHPDISTTHGNTPCPLTPLSRTTTSFPPSSTPLSRGAPTFPPSSTPLSRGVPSFPPSTLSPGSLALALEGEEERLNSSGETNLDISDLDLSMEPDELIRLMDAELFE